MDIDIDTLKYDLEEKYVILNPFESKLNHKNPLNLILNQNIHVVIAVNRILHMKICKIKAKVKAEKDKIENNKIAFLLAWPFLLQLEVLGALRPPNQKVCGILAPSWES